MRRRRRRRRREEERKRRERERKRKQLEWIISCRYVFLLFYFLLKTTKKKLHVISHKSERPQFSTLIPNSSRLIYYM